MIKIYEVCPDPDEFQSLMPEDPGVTGPYVLDGTEKTDWLRPRVRVYTPLNKVGDFFLLWPGGGIVFGPRALYELRGMAEQAGQLLPVDLGGEEMELLNVTECVDCLDHDRTEWVYGQSTGKPIRVKKYSFLPHLLPESSLFKLPRFRKGKMFAYEGAKAPEDEFKCCVERLSLKGLKFEQVWEGE